MCVPTAALIAALTVARRLLCVAWKVGLEGSYCGRIVATATLIPAARSGSV